MEGKALETELWRRKDMGASVLARAVMTESVELGFETKYRVNAGDQVLVTMFSRFGHIGIRGQNMTDLNNVNYDGCAAPTQVKDLTFIDPKAGRLPGGSGRCSLWGLRMRDGGDAVVQLIKKEGLLHDVKGRTGWLMGLFIAADFDLTPESLAPYTRQIITCVNALEFEVDGVKCNDIEAGIVAGEVRVWKVFRGA